MQKKLILIAAILFLLVIAGCKGGIFGGKKEQRPISEVDIRKGIEGLKMEFLPNAPPENVFEGDENNPSRFPISLKIKNTGATDIEGSMKENKATPDVIEGGIIALGFEKAYVGLVTGKFDLNECKEEASSKLEKCRNSNENSEIGNDACSENFNLDSKECDRQNAVIHNNGRLEFGIKGKSIYSPLGDEDFLAIEAEAKKIGVQSEKHPSTIFATACYPYNTTLGTSVCIDPEIIPQEKGQKACQVKDLIFSEGQGGPVAVIKVETRILPQGDKVKPHFLIHIKNAGNGQIVNVSNFDKACTSEQLEYKGFFNTVVVSASLSGMPLKCNGDEVTKGDSRRVMVTLRKASDSALAKSEDLIRCTLEKMEITKVTNDGETTETLVGEADLINSGADAYVAPLKVVLEYGYTFTISKNIIIEKILTH